MTVRAIFSVDFEGIKGMEHPVPLYDLETTTLDLLSTLRRRSINGVFFVVGQLVRERPGLIEAIAGDGHEIGVHGVDHSNIQRARPVEFDRFADDLAQVCGQIAELCGYRPRGFRAPYLMSPVFYDSVVYRCLADLDFTWASNREIRWPEELFRPGRIAASVPWGSALRSLLLRPPLVVALNPALLLQEWRRGHLKRPARWLLRGPGPFERGPLMEYPVLSPMDCDLIGLPDPTADTDPALIDYAEWALLERLDRSGEWFSLTIHDWISATANRLPFLESVLDALAAQGELRWIRPGLDSHLTGNAKPSGFPGIQQ